MQNQSKMGKKSLENNLNTGELNIVENSNLQVNRGKDCVLRTFSFIHEFFANFW